LVDERDGKGLGDDSAAKYKRIYHVDLAAATDVSNLHGMSALAEHVLSKTLVLDVVEQLVAHGIAPEDVPAKIEGLAFGPDVELGGTRKRTLFVSTDNDFLATLTDKAHPEGIDNPNQFFVFALDPALVPGYTPQALCADPAQDD
jgi:hypothetical protein